MSKNTRKMIPIGRIGRTEPGNIVVEKFKDTNYPMIGQTVYVEERIPRGAG